ncbi:MAG: hypothetical protein RPR40_09360 [Bermanella sp.]
MSWPMVGVDSNEMVFGMDAKASPQGGVYGDLSADNPSHGQADLMY